MSHRRISISGLMAVVLFLAIAFAALRSRSSLWSSFVFSTVVFALLVVTLAAFYLRKPEYTGFALFGWTYLILAFSTSIIPRVITSEIVNEVFNRTTLIRPTIIRPTGAKSLPMPQMPSDSVLHSDWSNADYRLPWSSNLFYLLLISHSLLCPIFGLIGAVVAHVIALRRSLGPNAIDIGKFSTELNAA